MAAAAALHVPGLDPQEHHVHNAHVLRVIGRSEWRHVKIPCRAVHKQTVFSDGRQMRPPRDEGNVVTSLGEPGTQVSAYTSRTKDCNAHCASSEI
jgi:hypothetical protein